MSPSLSFSCCFFVYFPPQSHLVKQAGGRTFDVLKEDGWRVLTLHSTLKIEEGIWRGRGGGWEDRAAELILPLSSWMQAKLGPVNNAVLPSGRLFKRATCHIYPSLSEGSARRRCTSVLHVSTGTDRCHVAARAIVSTHLPQIGPRAEYPTAQWQK